MKYIALYKCPQCQTEWSMTNQGIFNRNISNSTYKPLDGHYMDCPSCEEEHIINWLPEWYMETYQRLTMEE